MNTSILIVDDQESVRHFFGKALEAEGHVVLQAASAADGVRVFRDNDPDLVVLDLKLPDGSGLEVLQEIRTIRKDASVIMVTGSSDVHSAVEAMRLGALDYLPKPVDLDHLLLVVHRVVQRLKEAHELDHLRASQRKEFGIDLVHSDESPMKGVLDLVRQVASSTSTSVLIEGESGTGKELVAHVVHQLSDRGSHAFLDINCASLPEELLESELFGHEKGAYTDAHAQKKGLLEMADGGTLFLDEVGEMSLKIQVKLLRVLERMSFRRVGGVVDINVDVRIVSATNRDLQEEVREGRFREDLYYRLKVVPIDVPPLRERPQDIELLALHFLRDFNRQFRKSFQGFTPEARELLHSYPWPGNVREMRNLIERTVLLSQGEWIDDGMVGLRAGGSTGGDSTGLHHLGDAMDGRIPIEGIDLEQALGEIEREIIRQASERTQWNQTRTARLLHMNRDKLRYRMKQYGLDRDGAPRS